VEEEEDNTVVYLLINLIFELNIQDGGGEDHVEEEEDNAVVNLLN
jgi:hypothetical protein